MSEAQQEYTHARGAPPVAAERSRSSFGRGLTLMTTLAERGQARADELADAVGIPVSTVYRYLRLLREHEFVVDRAGVYRCGPLLAGAFPDSGSYGRLVAIARPLMERLTDLTGETVTLTVRVGVSHALCIHQIESPQREHTAFRVGQRLPLHAGAGERVLLAFAPPEVVQMVLIGDLERYTKNTPGPEELKRKLASTRRSGITTSRSEYMLGALAIAVPVVVDDDVICSLTVSGPDARCDAGWQTRVKPVLTSAGRALQHLIRESCPMRGHCS